jgi:HAE1 family hydrophobic/amphiphilic exporter-1
MFPGFNANYIVVDIKGPVGSTLEDTRRVTERVEKMAESLPELDNFVTILGGSPIAITSDATGVGGVTSVNRASLTINLTKKGLRDMTSQEIGKLMRDKVATITEAEVEVIDLESGPPTGAPIEVRVLGGEFEASQRVAEHLVAELKAIEGTREVDSDVDHGTGEFHFIPKRNQLEYFGLTALQLATELRAAVFGSNHIKIVRSGEETPITVRLDFRDEACKSNVYIDLLERRDRRTICDLNPQNVDQLKRLLISTPKGQVLLSQLVDVELKPTIQSIRHRDTDRVIHVRAQNEEGYLPANLDKALQARMENYPLPEGIQLSYGGETEDTAESFRSLARAMIVGIILITLILVLQFNSFRQPFIILFTVPLALIGVFTGLALLGRNFSFPGFIGIVALSGVVVNDAIVLIDRINHHIRSGLPKLKAIVQSGQERLQPILLTTITTATGVLPLAFASEIWVDLSLSIFFGIIFATVLTLVMVPIFYYVLETDKELKVVKEKV